MTVITSVLWLSWSSPASACSCIESGPACQGVWQAPVVFLGRVSSIADVQGQEQNPPSFLRSRRVTFEVLESFRGNPRVSADVFTGRGGGDCGFAFQSGQTYVVYASTQPEGGGSVLTTGICSPTRAVSNPDEDEDVRYLRALSSPAPPRARVFGRVELWDVSHAAGSSPASPRPLSAIPIILTRGSETWRTRTDAAGRFEFTGFLQPGDYSDYSDHGDYSVRAEVPAGYFVYGAERKVHIPDPRACFESIFRAAKDDHVR
jgi:hypothetical protein